MIVIVSISEVVDEMNLLNICLVGKIWVLVLNWLDINSVLSNSISDIALSLMVWFCVLKKIGSILYLIACLCLKYIWKEIN